jgi:hypothetical protein
LVNGTVGPLYILIALKTVQVLGQKALTSRIQSALVALLWCFIDGGLCISFGECKERSFAPRVVCSPANSKLAKTKSTGGAAGCQYICAVYPASTPALLKRRPHNPDHDIAIPRSSPRIGPGRRANVAYIVSRVQWGSCVISNCSSLSADTVQKIRCVF